MKIISLGFILVVPTFYLEPSTNLTSTLPGLGLPNNNMAAVALLSVLLVVAPLATAAGALPNMNGDYLLAPTPNARKPQG